MNSLLDVQSQATPSPGLVWDRVSNTEPALNPYPGHTAYASAFTRASAPGYGEWLDHVRPAAGCSHPVRLIGAVDILDAVTGQVQSSTDTGGLPDGIIYKACGNRRSAVCPGCSQTYAHDAYQLLRAGLAGGKGIPASVAGHPAVFATFTAPSFGAVHTRHIPKHTCADKRRCDCRPAPCRARRDATTCPHGQHLVCFARHDTADDRLGQPLCLDCYDHDHQVVWNISTGELWRRTKQAAERFLKKLAKQRRIPFVTVTTASGRTKHVSPVRISHGKAAEMQRRAAIHFHVLLRLDGIDPLDPDAIVPPPAGLTAADLDDAIRHAAVTTWTSPEHPDRPAGWSIVWGEQLDIRHLTLRGASEITDALAAGYLAKYATKSTEATGHRSARLTAETVDEYADADGDHTARLVDACWRLGRPTTSAILDDPTASRPAARLRERWTCYDCGTSTRLAECPECLRAEYQREEPADTTLASTAPPTPFYSRLRRWAHMLGYGGHFLTKARRYSVTFGLLRATRVTFARQQDTPASAPGADVDQADTETTIVLISLAFAGLGWHTTGDALLANTAAAKAREYARAAREELSHEIGSALPGHATAA